MEPYNASRQPKFQFCQKLVKVVSYVRAWPRPSRSAWAETLQTHGFPVQTYGETSKGRNFNSKAWIKNLSGQISNFDPFCVPMWKLSPKYSQTQQELDYLFKFAFFQASVHTKQKIIVQKTT